MDSTKKGLSVNNEIQSIVWLRAVCVVLILLCHITQTHSSPYVVMTSQIFNVGVNIFIIISGFLFGILGVKRPYLKWYAKRIRRIFIPYWSFLLIFWIIGLLTDYRSAPIQWIMTIPGLQCFTYYPRGAEHTWFITAILLCYLTTPLLALITQKLPKKHWGYLLAVLLLAPAAICAVPNAPIFATVFFFGIAFLLGKQWDRIHLSKATAVWSLVTIAAAFLLRFAAKAFIDGTLLYSGIVALYTHYIAGFAALFFFAYVFERRPWSVVRVINDLSFEIYLCHYMFLWPPLSTIGITSVWIVDVCLALIATMITAWLVHTGSLWIEKRLLTGKK